VEEVSAPYMNSVQTVLNKLFREVPVMQKFVFIPESTEQPDLDSKEYFAFRVQFQKAILLSLLEQKKITMAQYEVCLKKVDC
jgi:hypothetical protein